MKLVRSSIIFILVLFTSALVARGQSAPEAYAFALSPSSGQAITTESGGQRMVFEENGVSISVTQEASVYEPDSRCYLDNIRIHITLSSASQDVKQFTDGVAVSFGGATQYYAAETGTSSYALPEDGSGVFKTGMPYEITLVFKNLERELTGDRLDITLHLPDIKSSGGTVLMDAKVIDLEGQIQRS